MIWVHRILPWLVFLDLFADARSQPSLECDLGPGLLQLGSNIAPVEILKTGVWEHFANTGKAQGINHDDELSQQEVVEILRNIKVDTASDGKNRFLGLVGALLAVVWIAAFLGWLHRTGYKEDKESTQPLQQPIAGDTYHAMVASLVRDSQVISTGYYSLQRPVRLVSSVVILFVQMAIQIWLLYEIHVKVINKVVPLINELYDRYEVTMYSTTHISPSGHPRGYPKDFMPLNWLTLPKVEQAQICGIPISNDEFLMAIIFVWTMSCMVDMRESSNMFWRLVIMCPTADSVSQTVSYSEDGNVNVSGLTISMKLFVTMLAIFPRFALDCCLLVMGCSWLAATTDFSEVILNTVALEFILKLRKLTFHAFVPQAYRRALKTTYILIPVDRRQHPQLLFEKFCWILAAFAFCVCYVYYFEDVLPDYHWDIAPICSRVKL